MTVSTINDFVVYNANSIQVAFPTTFKFFDDVDLYVYVIDASGVATLKALTTDYTVSGDGGSTGGTVTFLSAPTTGNTVRIQRWITPTQDSDYVDGAALPAETMENNLDRLTMITQQGLERTGGTTFDLGAALGVLTRNPLDIMNWTAQSARIENVADAQGSQDAVTLTQLQSAQMLSGNLPTPSTPGQDSYMLLASAGAFVISSPTAVKTALGIGTATQRGYIDGLQVSCASGVLTIQAGVATDSTNATVMNLASSITKTTSGTPWVAGSGNSGRPTGATFTGTTTIHIFLISKADGTTDVGVDSSLTATNLLAQATGYTLFRRILSTRLSSGAMVDWAMSGDEVFLVTPTIESHGSIGTTASTITLGLPTGINVWGNMTALCTAGTSCVAALYSANSTLSATLLASPEQANLYINVPAAIRSLQTDTSGRVKARSSVASTTIAITVYGYTDRRGRN